MRSLCALALLLALAACGQVNQKAADASPADIAVADEPAGEAAAAAQVSPVNSAAAQAAPANSGRSSDGDAAPPEAVIAEHGTYGCSAPADARPRDGYQQGADLNGDGRADYVLDTHSFSCVDAVGPFCGSVGCTVEVVFSAPSGYVRQNPTMQFGGAAAIVTEGGRSILRDTEGPSYRWTGSGFVPNR